MDFRALLPEPATVDVDELLASLQLESLAPDDRPYTVANFIASADGRASIAGKSGPLGDDGDHAMFHGLREQVDAVLAGTNTLATENYGRILGKEERRARRVASGRAPEPLTCIVTRSGSVPLDIPLFSEPEARVLLFTGADVDLGTSTAQVEVVSLDAAEMTLTTAMRRLRADHGVRSVLCEGGPTLFGSLVHEELVDELFLTVGPKLAGGGRGPTIAAGAELAEPRSLTLRWLLERHGSLFTRYSLR